MDEEDQFLDAFDRREAERIMSSLGAVVSRHLGSPERDRVQALIERTRRDLDRDEVRRLAAMDDEFRAKRRGETDAQWKARVAQADLERVNRIGDLVPPEAYQHRSLKEALVMHVETNTMARTVRDTGSTSLDRMLENGSLTMDQHEAAVQITAVFEMIGRDVWFKSSTLERIDCGSGPIDLLAERLAAIRLQATYSLWRQRLPMPRSLVIDMITTSGSMAGVARSYRTGWRRARSLLIRALDNWLEVREIMFAEVDQREVDAALYRLHGTGTGNAT